MLKERRLHPRYAVAFPVWLTTRSATGEPETVQTMALDLSLGGLRLDCSAAVLAALQAQPQFPLTCRLQFRLPGQEADVSCEARFIASRRMAQDHYHLGFKFLSFEQQGERQLRAFLTHRQQSA